MKKFLVLITVTLFALSLAIGCGQKEAEPAADKPPEVVKEAEAMDSTAMDSAAPMEGGAEEVADTVETATEGGE